MTASLRVDALKHRVLTAGSVRVSVTDYVPCGGDNGQLDAPMVVRIRRAVYQLGVDQTINHRGGGRRLVPRAWANSVQ
jgi:hypothetical protein